MELLSAKLKNLAKQCHEHEISLATLVARLGVDSHAFVVLLIALPFLTPIPLPGLSLVFGSLIALSGLAILFGRPIWLPQIIGDRKISGENLERFFVTGSDIIKKFEHLFKPRLQNIFGEKWARFISGTLIFLSGLILALPLPPGTNFPPAFICVVLALGQLVKDYLLTVLGLLLFILKIIVARNIILYVLEKI